MQNIIDETEKRAYIFLKEFGFNEDEVVPVVTKGIFELGNTLEKLRTLLVSCHEHDAEVLDDTLHALKGLLFQLGNHALAEKIEELRSNDDITEICKELNKKLFQAE
jgi:hypothetical protein